MKVDIELLRAENAYIRMALRGTYLQKVQAARKLNLTRVTDPGEERS